MELNSDYWTKSLLPCMQFRFQSDINLVGLVFQIWSVPVGYEDLTGALEPITNGEIFGINNEHYPSMFHDFSRSNRAFKLEKRSIKVEKQQHNVQKPIKDKSKRATHIYSFHSQLHHGFTDRRPIKMLQKITTISPSPGEYPLQEFSALWLAMISSGTIL